MTIPDIIFAYDDISQKRSNGGAYPEVGMGGNGNENDTAYECQERNNFSYNKKSVLLFQLSAVLLELFDIAMIKSQTILCCLLYAIGSCHVIFFYVIIN